MKKIGIVTVVGYNNYGNLLQNYAVTKLLQDMGYGAVTLNNECIEDSAKSFEDMKKWEKLQPYYLKRYFRVKAFQKIGSKNTKDFYPLNMLKLFKNKKKFQQCKELRLEKFREFRKCYIPYEPLSVEDRHFSEKDYMAFVCGSDVVWHPRYHYNKKNDFLGFAPRSKRIALAPSFGVSEIPENRQEDYKIWLNGIEHLSVREKSGAEIIKSLIKKEAEVLPDPTLMIDTKHWREISRRPDNTPDKSYVLCYFLGNVTLEYSTWIEQCTKMTGKEVVSVCDADFLQYYAMDPSEFLWLIDHADAVFTDSFHGVVFSMLFQTPFVAFRRVEEGLSIFSRIESLLQCTKMEEREFGKVEVNQFDKLDFKCADEKIEKLKEKEVAFLKKAFNEIEKV